MKSKLMTIASLLAVTALACAPDRQLPAGDGATGNTPAATVGLPCEVARVLEASCLSCHGATPLYGAPMALATLDDLHAPTPGDPTRTAAEASLARMKDVVRPMPPGAPASAADVAVLAQWLDAGAKAGTCGSTGATPPPDPGTTSPPTRVSGLPCDVAKVLTDRCTSCHGNPSSAGAPMSLVTYADLAQPAMSDRRKSTAQMSLQRMKDAGKPMPPGGPVPAAELAVVEAWVSGGAPAGTCDVNPVPTAPLPDRGNRCTSQSFWRGGDEGSSDMDPGLACLACHRGNGEGPQGVAGTVYPSAHEPDLCNGEGGLTVVITDAAGKVVSLPVNSAGNFSSGGGLRFPIRALVKSGSRVREMLTPQMSGDCNMCHTARGSSGAPGRVVAP